MYRVGNGSLKEDERMKLREMIEEVCRSCESENCTLLFDEAQQMMVFCSAFYAGLREKRNSSYIMRNMRNINTASPQLLLQGP
jgi:hypothetical protein